MQLGERAQQIQEDEGTEGEGCPSQTQCPQVRGGLNVWALGSRDPDLGSECNRFPFDVLLIRESMVFFPRASCQVFCLLILEVCLFS